MTAGDILFIGPSTCDTKVLNVYAEAVLPTKNSVQNRFLALPSEV